MNCRLILADDDADQADEWEPYRLLARAVIVMCLKDAGGNISRIPRQVATATVRAQARAALAHSPEIHEVWCPMAGLNVDVLREKLAEGT